MGSVLILVGRSTNKDREQSWKVKCSNCLKKNAVVEKSFFLFMLFIYLFWRENASMVGKGQGEEERESRHRAPSHDPEITA